MWPLEVTCHHIIMNIAIKRSQSHIAIFAERAAENRTLCIPCQIQHVACANSAHNPWTSDRIILSNNLSSNHFEKSYCKQG